MSSIEGFMWKECACRSHFYIVRSCRSRLLYQFAGWFRLFVPLLVLWTCKPSLKCWVSTLQTALQEHVNANQHFDSKSNHERGLKHFCFVTKLPLCMCGNHRLKPLTSVADLYEFHSKEIARTNDIKVWDVGCRMYLPCTRQHMQMYLSGQISVLVELVLKFVSIFEKTHSWEPLTIPQS